ncbi:MAG TPA: (d)CMP kinase [Selenomonadales bacterium]|nr:(d)CMP kinase [Selenomonadales bacterium]
MKRLTIAIDGPAGAGKSTVARIVAQRLAYTYIDSGAMYRAVTWAVSRQAIAVTDREAVIKAARSLNLALTYRDGKTQVLVDGEDVSESIRTPEISRQVSEVAKIGGVREAMVRLQRQLASFGGVVMDGRDIGTHVLPDADIKIFLTASIKERARRRWQELSDKGYTVSLEDLTKDISCRDRVDCERDIAPLIQAADAVLIDTTALTIHQAVEQILRLCEERTSGLQNPS